MNYFRFVVFLALANLLPIAGTVLSRLKPWKTMENLLLTCPPGFFYPEKRAYCFRVLRGSQSVTFHAASWACSVYPGGTLAHMKRADEDYVIRYIERGKGLQIPEGNTRRVWVGIRRQNASQPFAYVLNGYPINESDYRIHKSPEGTNGDCMYWDLISRQFETTACDDDENVDGFLCQAKFELQYFCNTSTEVQRFPCCSRRYENTGKSSDKDHTETCSRFVSKKIIPMDSQTCAINQSCILQPPKRIPNALFFEPGDDKLCRIYCTEDNVSPKKVACDSIVIDVEEECQCSDQKSAQCGTQETCNSQSSNTTSFAIAVSFLICFILIALGGLMVWRKCCPNYRQDQLLDSVALENVDR